MESFLDTTGGPNHVNNLCSSPVMIDIFPEKEIRNPSYFYIKHFSKHVTKGSIRRQSSSNHVLHNVFLRPDGKYVVVIMNETDDGQHVFSKHSNVTFDTFLPPHSIQTLILS